MYRLRCIVAGAGMLMVLAAVGARADAVADLLDVYRAAGAVSFDGEAGKRRWSEEFTDPGAGRQLSCASCHTQDLRQSGRHIRTHKPIEPMAPEVNPQRLCDAAKIEKWFLRNCKGTWGRECTPQEKGDFLVYIQKQ